LIRLKGFQKLTSISSALNIWLNSLKIKKCEYQEISLKQALNRVLSSDIIAKEDLPRFKKSAVDGYALRSSDLIGATQLSPINFKIITSGLLSSHQAFPIWTGNPLPKNTDTAVMIEHTKKTNSQLKVYIQLPKGANVSKKGEDLKKGEVAIKSGTRLKPQHLALISALGFKLVKVSKKPRIGILATGNELVTSDVSRSRGQIFESNRIMLAGLCSELGCETVDLGISKDNPEEIAQKLEHGIKKCDALITTGGTSVGKLDFVPDVVNNLGAPGVLVHGMALRPAMPTGLAVVKRKPILILSGNPVAAIIGFEVFMRPLVFKMLGLPFEPRPIIRGILTRKNPTRLGRVTYLRVKVYKKNEDILVEPISSRGSSIISSMTKANGFVIVPSNREGLRKGELVSVQLFDSLKEGI
jgi:molybdopterin molybdotransferase